MITVFLIAIVTCCYDCNSENNTLTNWHCVCNFVPSVECCINVILLHKFTLIFILKSPANQIHINIRNIFNLQQFRGLLSHFTIILVTAVESWQIVEYWRQKSYSTELLLSFGLSVQEVNTNQMRLNFPDDSHLKCDIKQILLIPTERLMLNMQ